MGTSFRKNPMVRALDLRNRRRMEGLSTMDMAEVMAIANPKQLSAIEIGTCAITLERAVLAAYRLGGIIVELVGTGCAVVAPLQGFSPEDLPKPDNDKGKELKPGEAAWRALKENREATERMDELQPAIERNDRQSMVELYDELICDPLAATGILARTIEQHDPSIKAEAEARHSAKSSYISKPDMKPGPQTNSNRPHIFGRRQYA